MTDTDRLVAEEPPTKSTAALRADVDGNGAVDAQDILWAIYYFDRPASEVPALKLDVNADLQFDDADILLAISDLNSLLVADELAEERHEH